MFLFRADSMTITVEQGPGASEVGFARLHALVARGYRPIFDATARAPAPSFITLHHPRAAHRDTPPPITLWSDGILATTKVLFPRRFVPEDGKGPPDWQRFILPGEAERFATFIAEIDPPRVVDLYLAPTLAQARTFALRFAAGAALCFVLAALSKLVLRI